MPIKKKKALYSEKRLYEILALFPGNIADKDEEKNLEVLKKHITSVEGEVKRLENWGKRMLTFNIRGNEKACFAFCHFFLDSEQISALKKELRLDTSILRTLITVVPEQYTLPETGDTAKEFLGWGREPIAAEDAELMRDSYEKKAHRRRNQQDKKMPEGDKKKMEVSVKKKVAPMAKLDQKLDEILSK